MNSNKNSNSNIINNSKQTANIYQKILIKNNINYKFFIENNKKEIIFICEKYKAKYNINDIKLKTNNKFNNIDKKYESIIQAFNNYKVTIKEILMNKKIKLEINIGGKINEKNNLEIILLYNNDNKKNNIINKKQNENNINNIYKNNNIFLNTNPLNIEIKNNIAKESTPIITNNQILIFKSINDFLYLFYINFQSIIIFNLIDNVKILEIKNAHEYSISELDHCLDTKNSRDLVLSKAYNDIKLWDVNNFECILVIKKEDDEIYLNFALLLNINQQCLIVEGLRISKYKITMNIYDLKGVKIRKVNNILKSVFFICSYYNKKNKKNYIISCGHNELISYDFEKNNIYNSYHKSNDDKTYNHLAILDNDKIVKLFGSSDNGIINIWNFNSGKLIDTIKILDYSIIDICLWNSNYLFVSCKFKAFKLIELSTKSIVKTFNEKGYDVGIIKKFIHPEYGESLITVQEKGKINLWINK